MIKITFSSRRLDVATASRTIHPNDAVAEERRSTRKPSFVAPLMVVATSKS